MTIETHNTNPKTTKPSRWFRFRLRTLLVMVTVLSVPLGWVGWELDQRRREKEVVAWVEEMGGQVIFSSVYPYRDRSWWEKTTDNWLGERVWVVGLTNRKVSDFSPLAELKKLEMLDLRGTEVGDLSPLAELKKLKILLLENTPVRELSPLTELKNLQLLDLNHTQVSDEQVSELRQALPKCDIAF